MTEREAECVLLGHVPTREVMCTQPPTPWCQWCGKRLFGWSRVPVWVDLADASQ